VSRCVSLFKDSRGDIFALFTARARARARNGHNVSLKSIPGKKAALEKASRGVFHDRIPRNELASDEIKAVRGPLCGTLLDASSLPIAFTLPRSVTRAGSGNRIKVERLKGAAGLMRQPLVSSTRPPILSPSLPPPRGSSINEIDTDAG